MPLHVVWAALWGCAQPHTYAPGHTRSGTLVEIPHSDYLVAANTDDGSVSLVNPLTGHVTETPLGPEPTRVTAAAGRVWASLRLEGQVAMLELEGDELVERARAWVGSEPFGIVASATGDRVYVALSQDDAVLELQGDTLEPLRRFEMHGEPRWLALHPDGSDLAVGLVNSESLRVVRLESGGVKYLRYTHDDTAPPLRLTGDLAFTPDGATLLTPLAELTAPRGPTIMAYYAPPAATPVVQGRLGAFGTLPGDTERDTVMVTAHYINHVYSDPEEDWIYVAQEGLGSVTALGAEVRPIFTGGGPSGMAVDAQGGRWAHLAHDRTIRRLGARPDDIQLTEPSTDPVWERGRELFYAANNPRMSQGAVSCAGCHADGRSDNHTWELITGRWQTPSLAGNVDATPPVTWAQEVGSIAEEAVATTTGPMGGAGLDDDDLEALVSFVRSVRLPNPPTVHVSAETLALGEQVFHRPDVGCFECHPAPAYTDNRSHHMFGIRGVTTPSLRGVAATAPYLHDGRADTLREVLERSAHGEMGNPEHLTDEERDALIAWLRTL
ncbi:MAG: c-type cytochrome [Myxococcales bacterium]|nr:c-type cytochrome [Myxococcales bacterium]